MAAQLLEPYRHGTGIDLLVDSVVVPDSVGGTFSAPICG